MPTARSTLAANRDNPHDRWESGEGSAAARIATRVIVPVGRQSFTAAQGQTFFAIGSCFARNVEERLEQAGAQVTSRNIAVRDLGNASAREGGTFNKYTPLSILQELKWAAGIESFPPEAFLPVGGDEFYDPYLSGKAGRGTIADLMLRRQEVAAYFAQAFTADVVILTLGLIETWFDRDTGLSLNEAPNPRVLTRHVDRFDFECLSLERCEAALDEILAILDAHGKPGQKRIVTVSPVPLGRTFTDEDIAIANMTSKSTLRVAARRVVDRTEGIDYFPSYETVMLSDPALCWQEDRRHVSDFIVGRIIQAFMTRYGVISAAPADPAAEIAALDADAGHRRRAAAADGDTDVLIAQMNRELNKYKNMVIRLQAALKQSEARQAAGGAPLASSGSAPQDDPAFRRWSELAETPDALIVRLHREVNKYKAMVIRLQGELRSFTTR
jgi:hypothetical protein